MAKEPEIVGRECRFATHVPGKHYNDLDIHVVKEQVHLSDNTIKPNIRIIKNYPRPFWVTKPTFRNHKEKKNGKNLTD